MDRDELIALIEAAIVPESKWRDDKYESCRRCGIIRRRDDKNGECRGDVKITLRNRS